MGRRGHDRPGPPAWWQPRRHRWPIRPSARDEASIGLVSPGLDGSYRHPPAFVSGEQIAGFWNTIDIPDEACDKLDVEYRQTTGTNPARIPKAAIQAEILQAGNWCRSYFADLDPDYQTLYEEYVDIITRHHGTYTTDDDEFTSEPDIPVIRTRSPRMERFDKPFKQARHDSQRANQLHIQLREAREAVLYRMARQKMEQDNISYPPAINAAELRPSVRVCHMLYSARFALDPPETGPERKLRIHRETEHLHTLPIHGSSLTVGQLAAKYHLTSNDADDLRLDPEPTEADRQHEHHQMVDELQQMRYQLAAAQQEAADQANDAAIRQNNLYAQQQQMAQQAETEAKRRKQAEAEARWARRVDRWSNQ